MPAKAQIRVLLSPSEEALAEKMGDEAIVSTIPEQKGADILIYSKHGLVGIQRKEVPSDFISSFADGRIARALSLLVQSCKFTRLVCEGRFKYWPDGAVHLGMLKGGKRVPSRFTRAHIHGMLNDIEFIRGVIPRWTDDLDDTVRYIRSVVSYLNPDKHLGLYNRPSAKGLWYVPTAKDTQLWLLQSFPGIGPAIADKIVERFGGVPMQWTCTLEELVSIPRMSKERAREMYGVLSAPAHVDTITLRLARLRSLLG